MPRTKTTWLKGKPGGPGRPRKTEEEKRAARIRRAAEYDFKQECLAAMPIATDQLIADLEAKKLRGGELVRTVEMLRDSTYGKPPQTIQGAGGGPLIATFTGILQTIDVGKTEKL